MSSTASELTVEVNGRDVGLSELLSRIETELSKVATTSEKTSQDVEKLGSSGQRATSGLVSLQQAQARLELQQAALARAQGDTARAAQLEATAQQRLQGILNGVQASTTQTIAVERQLAQVQTQVAKEANSGASYFQQFGQSVKGSLVGVLGPAAAAAAAVGALKGAVDLAQVGAQLQGTERSFKSLSASAGQSSQALLTSMRAAASGTVSDAKLMESANTGLLLSNGKIAKDLPKLIEIARASAQATGQDIGFIFDSLVRGISRGSPQIIDNAGITLDAAGAFETYAKSIGKSADQLSKAEQQQATLIAVVSAGNDIIQKTGLAADSNAQSFANAGVAVENLKNKFAELLANGLAPAARGFTQVVNSVATVASASEQANGAVAKAFSGAKSFDDYGKRISFVGEQLSQLGIKTRPLTEAQFNYAQSLTATGVSAGQAIAQSIAFNDTLVQIGNAQRILRDDFGASAQQIDALSQAMVRVGQSGAAGAGLIQGLTSQLALGTITADQAAAALAGFEQAQRSAGAAAAAAAISVDDDRVAMGQLQVATAAAQQAVAATNAAMEESAAKSVADQAAKDAQSAVTALLAAQTKAAADAFLALNPGIDGSGVASAQASGKISAAVAQYIQMTLAAASARNELAQLQAQAGVAPAVKAVPANRFLPVGRTDLADGGEGKANADRLRELNKQEQEHAAAVRQAILTNGTAAQKQALYNRELADAARIYGVNSTQAIKAKTALDSFTASQKKGGGGGGGARVSEQQKLNNSLLADQQKYQDKSEDLAAQSEQKRLQILRDFQQKMRDAQRDFDQSQLEGRAGFYDNLGAIESDKIRKSASAQYEAAAIEAGRIAQEKGADVADKYMAAQEQIISARAKRLAEIEKAEKEKDGGKAEYLRGVDAQYQAAEDAKLARIKEGEGSLAAERDKQLADAGAKEEQAQDKIASAADRAADRKIAAADRAGKKIDEEQAKAAALAATYDKIVGAGAPPANGGQPAAPAAPAAAAPDAAQPLDLAAVLAKLDELRGALVAATDKGAAKVADAVKSAKRDGGVNS